MQLKAEHLRIGDLTTLITIEEPSTDLNSAGQRTGWKTFTQLYAMIEPLRGRELLQGRMLVSPVNTRIRTRYYAGITPKMRVAFEGRTMKIDSVIDIENKHIQLELLCVEIQ